MKGGDNNMPVRGGIGLPTEYMDKDGNWTSEGVVTTEVSMTLPNGQKVEIIKDGKLVESEAVKPNLAERVIQIFRKRGTDPEQPATAGGKERLG